MKDMIQYDKDITSMTTFGIPAKAKYFADCSGDSVLACFNDMKYNQGDGELHRAAFVQKITVKKGE